MTNLTNLTDDELEVVYEQDIEAGFKAAMNGDWEALGETLNKTPTKTRELKKRRIFEKVVDNGQTIL